MLGVAAVRVLIWHVHRSWTSSFVHGPFDSLVPLVPDRGPRGRGRPTTCHWPERAVEASPADLRDGGFDVVLLQRPGEIDVLHRWTGLVAGRDIPAIYVEHNAPPCAASSRHPLADQSAIPIVHVTRFNDLMWDSGAATTHVIEHGILDPGPRWRGHLPRAVYVENEPLRGGRITGTDLVGRMADSAPIDAFGIDTQHLTSGTARHEVLGHGYLAHDRMLDLIAERRVYLHLRRWTSLGPALLEAMHLAMPVVALATTEAPEALEGSGAFLSNDPDRLARVVRTLVHDHDAAAAMGGAVRAHALQRFGLARFHAEWDLLLKEVSR